MSQKNMGRLAQDMKRELIAIIEYTLCEVDLIRFHILNCWNYYEKDYGNKESNEMNYGGYNGCFFRL